MNIMIKQLLGKRIKEIRKSKKLTQEKLAELVNIETSSVCNIENGRYYPSAENLDNIMQVLHISPEELFLVQHNKPKDIIVKELNNAMMQNEKLARLIYNFYLSLKYQDL